jgi:O-methyltransferase
MIDYQEMMQRHSQAAGYADMDRDFVPIFNAVRSFTMTSVERMFDLYKSVEYIVKAGIPGDIVECGVWRGGSMMLVAQTLQFFGDTSRGLWLYDTFEGHPKPAEDEVDLWGHRAIDDWQKEVKADGTTDWGRVGIEEVAANMAATGYPGPVKLVKGMVEETARLPTADAFALVRLDTDWFPGAKISMETFWPRLSRGGVLVIDDYGHYMGQREAVDAYFARHGIAVKLNRVDYSCRTAIKR